jgi:transcriptional regulator with XRE-family HTH domain
VVWAREQAGFTKSDVARQLGVSLSLISMIESGTRNAQPELIESMARILGCPPDDLKRKDGPPGKRLAVVCAECSGLWAPDHECPNGRAA